MSNSVAAGSWGKLKMTTPWTGRDIWAVGYSYSKAHRAISSTGVFEPPCISHPLFKHPLFLTPHTQSQTASKTRLIHPETLRAYSAQSALYESCKRLHFKSDTHMHKERILKFPYVDNLPFITAHSYYLFFYFLCFSSIPHFHHTKSPLRLCQE